MSAVETLDSMYGLEERGAEQAKREFLTFRLGEETYGIDILQVIHVDH